tara:strand:+ start:1497 stop:1676 length:180 start_codon:yes stop_codon:yes gene_type:complete
VWVGDLGNLFRFIENHVKFRENPLTFYLRSLISDNWFAGVLLFARDSFSTSLFIINKDR